jgi:hypothetical protein
MKPPTLGRCSSCACFIRLTETACPFCAAPVPKRASAARPPQLKTSPPATLRVRLRQNVVWAFGASTLAIAPACGGVITAGGEDASADAATNKENGGGDEPEAADARVAEAAAADARAADARQEVDANRCDVFLVVDYGAPGSCP